MDFTWGVTSYNEKFQKNTIIYIFPLHLLVIKR